MCREIFLPKMNSQNANNSIKRYGNEEINVTNRSLIEDIKIHFCSVFRLEVIIELIYKWAWNAGNQKSVMWVSESLIIRNAEPLHFDHQSCDLL